jgi:hypothetical protein
MDVATGAERARVDTVPPSPPWSRWLQRPAVAGAVLLALYLLASTAMSTEGFLGTDTGGKVATVKVMSERADFDPDVGYWAEDWDPDGRVHGLYYTSKVGDRYINVTSLPMVLAARPLYATGPRCCSRWPVRWPPRSRPAPSAAGPDPTTTGGWRSG